MKGLLAAGPAIGLNLRHTQRGYAQSDPSSNAKHVHLVNIPHCVFKLWVPCWDAVVGHTAAGSNAMCHTTHYPHIPCSISRRRFDGAVRNQPKILSAHLSPAWKRSIFLAGLWLGLPRVPGAALSRKLAFSGLPAIGRPSSSDCSSCWYAGFDSCVAPDILNMNGTAGCASPRRLCCKLCNPCSSAYRSCCCAEFDSCITSFGPQPQNLPLHLGGMLLRWHRAVH